MIAFISQSMRLEAGDLIYTGTPAGVGAVFPGDVLSAEVDGVAQPDHHYRQMIRACGPAPWTSRGRHGPGCIR